MVRFNPSSNGTTGVQPALLRKSVLSIRLMVTSHAYSGEHVKFTCRSVRRSISAATARIEYDLPAPLSHSLGCTKACERYGEPIAVSNAIGYTKHRSRVHTML